MSGVLDVEESENSIGLSESILRGVKWTRLCIVLWGNSNSNSDSDSDSDSDSNSNSNSNCCGASVASVAAVHNLNIKERYKNLRFCHGLLASLSADHNALLCGRASFSADHNSLRCEEPRFQRTRMHCAFANNNNNIT